MGASVGAVVQFEATQYVPQDIQNDYATGKQYADQFSSIASGISFHNGALEMSPAAQEAADTTFMAAFTAAAPVLGAALDVLLAVAPKAGPGPGVCVTDPPSGSTLAEIQGWDHYFPWSKFYGSYDPGPSGSFEQLANAALEYNWLLGANCFSSKVTPAPIILAALVASWNATHAGPTRTICRSGLNPPSWGLPPGYDPFANALEQAIPTVCPPCHQQSAFGCADPGYTCGPNNVTSCVTINNGPRVVHVRPLTLHLTPAQLALTSAKASPPAKSSGAGAVVAVGAVAGLAWWLSTPGAMAKLARLFRF